MNSKMKTKEDQLFWKQSYYSMRPTLEETGIGLGGFKKPIDVELNVDVGDLAILECPGANCGIKVRVIKYAGERPWWKGYLHLENHGPCWIIKSQSRLFEVHYIDGGEGEDIVKFYDSMPMPDSMLEKIYE
jgi:hypothetical protein